MADSPKSNSGAGPQEMAAYYENFPTPPQQPQCAPSSPEYQAAMEQYNAQMEAFEAAKAAYEEQYGPPPSPAPVSPPSTPGGGKPAARLGDMTAHGGSVIQGYFTVLIGNKPAARVGDMHACPMVTGVVPHGGGPVLPPGAPKVLIGFLPAARMGDLCTCTGPPDVIAQGEFTVMIGG